MWYEMIDMQSLRFEKTWFLLRISELDEDANKKTLIKQYHDAGFFCKNYM